MYLFWATFLSVSGHLMSLSSVLTIEPNVGRWVLSFCQQSNISWYIASGQSIGAGNLEISNRNRLYSNNLIIAGSRNSFSRETRVKNIEDMRL